MIPSISADVIAIFALVFTILMAKRHIFEKNNISKNYIIVAVTTIILLGLEITTIFLELSNNRNFIIPNRIANVLGFSLSPAVPYMFFMFNNKNMKRTLLFRILYMPLYFNALMCIISYKTGWIFFVDSQNQYIRGNLFLLPTIVSALYILLIFISEFKNSSKHEIEDRNALITIISFLIIVAITQIIFKDFIILWSSVAIALLLYYVFLREMQFTYDETGVKNRKSFEKEMYNYINYNKELVICVFDINNLKENSDLYGHKYGDEIILIAAEIIQEIFMNIGKAYRIGGDEFCVICKDISSQMVEQALSNLDDAISKENQNRTSQLILAYGYAFYNKNRSDSIYSAFAQADKAMYTHKAKLKKNYEPIPKVELGNLVTTSL